MTFLCMSWCGIQYLFIEEDMVVQPILLRNSRISRQAGKMKRHRLGSGRVFIQIRYSLPTRYGYDVPEGIEGAFHANVCKPKVCRRYVSLLRVTAHRSTDYRLLSQRQSGTSQGMATCNLLQAFLPIPCNRNQYGKKPLPCAVRV